MLSHKISLHYIISLQIAFLLCSFAKGFSIPPPAEDKITHFVNQWVTAQNQRNFNGLQSYYSPQLQAFYECEADCREREKSTPQDLNGWMKRRKQILSPGSWLQIEEVTREIDDENKKNWVVSLYYALRNEMIFEIGTMTLTLEPSAETFAIIEESIQPKKQEKILPKNHLQYMPLTKGILFPIISKHPYERWVKGPILQYYSAPASFQYLSRTFDERRLPNSLQRWIGKEIALYDKTGLRCISKVAGFQITRPSFQPNDESPQKVQRKFLEKLDPKDWEPRELSDFFSGGYDDHPSLLVAKLKSTQGCNGATWARDASLPHPLIVKAIPASHSLTEQTIARVHTLPSYRRIQQKFMREIPAEKRKNPFWERYQDGKPEVRLMRIPNQNITYVSVVLNTYDHCGEDSFQPFLWIVFKIRETDAKSPMQLVAEEPNLIETSPSAMINIDGDGTPEFLMEDGILQKQGDHYRYEMAPLPRWEPC